VNPHCCLRQCAFRSVLLHTSTLKHNYCKLLSDSVVNCLNRRHQFIGGHHFHLGCSGISASADHISVDRHWETGGTYRIPLRLSIARVPVERQDMPGSFYDLFQVTPPPPFPYPWSAGDGLPLSRAMGFFCLITSTAERAVLHSSRVREVSRLIGFWRLGRTTVIREGSRRPRDALL
jgi:hypothetical protein